MMHDEPMEGASRFAFGLPAQYLGAEVFRFAPQWKEDISASYTKNASRLDYKSGVFRYDGNTMRSRQGGSWPSFFIRMVAQL